MTTARLLALLALASSGGCAGGCWASGEKLGALKRGMTYAETSEIMGCSGSLVTASAPDSGGFSIVEWDGPQVLSYRTRIEFEAGRLLSYTTERRGALEALTQPPP
jgi:hypothetical protein